VDSLDRQVADPNAAFGDGGDAPSGQIIEQLGNQALQKVDGSCPVNTAQSNEDDGRTRRTRRGHDSGEVRVEGDNDSILSQGAVENLIIRGPSHPDVSYVDDIPSRGEQVTGCPPWEAHVEEKGNHAADVSMGRKYSLSDAAAKARTSRMSSLVSSG